MNITVTTTAQEILDKYGKDVLRAVFQHKEWTPEEYERRLKCLSDHSKRKYLPSRVRTGVNSFEMRIVPSRYYPQPGDQNDMFRISLAVPIHWVFDVHDRKYDMRKPNDREAKEKLDAYNAGLPHYLEKLEIELSYEDAKVLGIVRELSAGQ